MVNSACELSRSTTREIGVMSERVASISSSL